MSMLRSPSKSPPVFGYDSATYLVRRGRVWQYRRRVPAQLAARLGKTEVRLSTQARDRTEALRTAAQISAAIEAEWRKLLVGDAAGSETAAAEFATTLTNAQSLGMTYLPASEIAASRLEEILTRIERIAVPLPEVASGRPADPAPSTVSAVLGGAGKPELKLSNLVEAYAKLAADQTIGKSER